MTQFCIAYVECANKANNDRRPSLDTCVNSPATTSMIACPSNACPLVLAIPARSRTSMATGLIFIHHFFNLIHQETWALEVRSDQNDEDIE
ncbi:hypothetical protein GHT06_010919 [Daphnia sinensis]|uniref:Uncharacterized protein n=1 Tax=Daphnia sinensis TaxID=1820382 RepID=A0AAD5LIR7_9CRUS|nr:hypothetical protein GHT06_010919 [Daphnia sinensis]